MFLANNELRVAFIINELGIDDIEPASKIVLKFYVIPFSVVASVFRRAKIFGPTEAIAIGCAKNNLFKIHFSNKIEEIIGMFDVFDDVGANDKVAREL